MIKEYELRIDVVEKIEEAIARAKQSMPGLRIVYSLKDNKILVNYGKLTPNQQFILELLITDIC